MDSYSLVIDPRVHQDLKCFPQEIVRQIARKIDALRLNPRPIKSKKLKGFYGGIHRLEVRRNYRVLYRIFDREKVVHVLRVLDRKEAYR